MKARLAWLLVGAGVAAFIAYSAFLFRLAFAT